MVRVRVWLGLGLGTGLTVAIIDPSSSVTTGRLREWGLAGDFQLTFRGLSADF